ncbi:MAG TPA: nucleotide sugar dehydrogenase [Solirubrobacteraceae bacterium]|jgi:UDPglucose 6-dehydrogenase
MSPPERQHRPLDGGRGLIGVVGLWHLGCVTSACLSEAGYDVAAVDPDVSVVEALTDGRAPLYEPGLDELIASNSARLNFSTDPEVLANTRRVWVTFDTPVDDDDRADVEWVLATTARLLESVPEGALVIVSSQLPVGSVAALQERCRLARGDGGLRFACVPENLRLGRALEAFRSPERVIAGVHSEADRSEVAEIFAPFGVEIHWMRVESAEMTKHALNGFLATSVSFMNEIATICESVGADAAEVSQGLKSEARIGPRAYLDPGDAFAGGTLARDIGFLRDLAQSHGLSSHVSGGVADGNAAHKRWAQRRLLNLLGDRSREVDPLAGRTVAVWGLTYKAGTDTLRRSNAIELCGWLESVGATVKAHDPVVSDIPSNIGIDVELCANPYEAVAGADALVICTAWPDYRDVLADEVLSALAQPLVIDPAGLLSASMATRSDVHYLRVGRAPGVSAPAIRQAGEVPSP